MGKIGSGNPYVYADNEPTMQVDPSGRLTCGGAQFLFYASAFFLAGGTIAAVVATGGVAAPLAAAAFGAGVGSVALAYSADQVSTSCNNTSLF